MSGPMALGGPQISSPTPSISESTGMVATSWTISPTTVDFTDAPGSGSANTSQLAITLQSATGLGFYEIAGECTYVVGGVTQPAVMLTPCVAKSFRNFDLMVQV